MKSACFCLCCALVERKNNEKSLLKREVRGKCLQCTCVLECSRCSLVRFWG